MQPADSPAPLERHPRDVMREHGFRTRKRLGQSFLVAPDNLRRVADAAHLSGRDVVLEIGTGLGRLTALLAERTGYVISVEIDRGLFRIASENLLELGNVRLLCCDFLESKHRIDPRVTAAAMEALSSRQGPLKVVSNLPYAISSPAIVNLLEWEVPVGELYLMVQKEVADRLTAEPGGKKYGPLTVYVAYWATAGKLFAMPRAAFWPVPEVSSALLKITRRPDRTRTAGYDAFSKVVGTLFSHRRKMLASVLRAGWGEEVAREIPEKLGIDPRVRAEKLTVADFEAIASLAGPPESA